MIGRVIRKPRHRTLCLPRRPNSQFLHCAFLDHPHQIYSGKGRQDGVEGKLQCVIRVVLQDDIL